MTEFGYDLAPADEMRIGLIILQTDESQERDLRRIIPGSVNLMVTRIPSAPEVSAASLAQMANELPASAALLPQHQTYGAIGYGCTSGASVIGPDRVADLVRSAVPVDHVTNPVTALLAACAALGVTRLGILSPYVAEVSDHLRKVLGNNGISTPVFGSFNEAVEEKVVRIAPQSIMAAAQTLAERGGIDALFLSCTNLRTFDVIAPLEERLSMPVLSSNQVIGWHLRKLAGLDNPVDGLGRLFAV